jgi:hypothetical protein
MKQPRSFMKQTDWSVWLVASIALAGSACGGAASPASGSVYAGEAAGVSVGPLGDGGTLPDGFVTTPLPDGDEHDSDPLPACSRTIPVATSAALDAAVAASQPGDCIVLADGSYTIAPIRGRQGTAAHPIVVSAAHPGKATVATGALTIETSAYVVVEGLLYTSTSGINITDCDHCRLTRSRIHITENGPISWVTVRGSTGGNNRVDHNELGPKAFQGNLVGVYGGSAIIQHTRIDHNLFHDVGPVTSNGWETIRVGLSGLGKSSGFTIIEDNLFRNTEGDPEIISLKTCDNYVRWNTLRTSKGQISVRIGSRNTVYGNYILGGGQPNTGGIRVHGQDHRVFDNYVEGVAGLALILEGGESEETPQPGTFHYRVYRAQVVNNTFIGGAGIQVGGVHPLSPVDSVIANNIVVGTRGALFNEALAPVNTMYLANIADPLTGATVGQNVPPDQIRPIDPKLVRVGEVLEPAAGSAAIGAARGVFSYITEDIDGTPRVKSDIGANQSSTAAPARHPLTEADVGPDAP